jgi:diguanylate cyclase (GGDEF)-like protein
VTQDQVLVALLGVLVVANVFLVASIPARTRRGASFGRSAGRVRGNPAAAAYARTAANPGTTAADDENAAAAIEEFVTGVRPEAPPIVRGRTLASGDRPSWTTPDLDRGLVGRDIGREPAPDGLADQATWSRAMREESARAARFGHPVTVVIAGLPRLDVLADRFGGGVADRVALEAARLLVSEARDTDRIAKLGDARFGVLLPETDETAAGDYVERVRTATDGWLESAGLSIRLSLGWASPAEGGDVMAAAATAEQRMREADRPAGPEPDAHGRRIAENRTITRRPSPNG